MHGAASQRYFEFPPGGHGRSQNELRFVFTRPAEIHQVDISVDVNDPRLFLVEFIAGINARQKYGVYREADWLMHASWSRAPGSPGAIDETASLPAGVVVGAGDFLGVFAYMGGGGAGDPLRVSPEVVVLYSWL